MAGVAAVPPPAPPPFSRPGVPPLAAAVMTRSISLGCRCEWVLESPLGETGTAGRYCGAELQGRRGSSPILPGGLLKLNASSGEQTRTSEVDPRDR